MEAKYVNGQETSKLVATVLAEKFWTRPAAAQTLRRTILNFPDVLNIISEATTTTITKT